MRIKPKYINTANINITISLSILVSEIHQESGYFTAKETIISHY